MGENGNQGGVLRFDAFELDIANGELRKNGRAVKLQPQPAKVLVTLASKPGKLVSRDEIRHQIWDGSTFVDFEQGLNFCIRQIRVALEDDREAPRFIETLSRRGYRFIAPVSAIKGESEQRVEKNRGLRLYLIYGGASAGITAFILAGFFLHSMKRTTMPSFSTWVQLTHFADSATSPALSSDGRMLTFIRGPETFAGPGQVYVKMLPDGIPAQLTSDGSIKMSPVFSPDGSRIAYTVAIRWDTWETPVLEREPRMMLANASGLSWIDEHQLLFSEIKNGRHMGIVTSSDSRSGERDIYLPTDQAGMVHRSALSPDGKWVVLAEMDSVHGWLPCRVVPFNGGASGETIGASAGHCTSAAWSPDGGRIYFSSDAGDGGFHIWRQEFPHGKAEQITSGPTEEEGVAMAPDGRSFITSVGMQESTVWIHDADGDQQVSPEGNAAEPRISADGGKIYYLVRMRGRSHLEAGSYASQDLWATDLRTKQSRAQLPGFPITGYSVSADEQYVACSVADSNGKSHVWIVSSDHRTPPEQIKTSLSDSEDVPIFGGNGELLFRGASGGRSYLYLWKGTGKSVERISRDAIIEPQNVSPDGRWAVAQVPLAGSDSPRGTAVFPVDGGEPIYICRMLCVASWTQDGRLLYLRIPGTSRHDPGGRTYVIPVLPGESLPEVARAGIGSEADLGKIAGVSVMDGEISPGPNGSTYAFVRTSVHRNLYRIPTP